MQGIYQIKFKKSGKVYIGSSNNIERRFRQHIIKLSEGTHHNYYLQRDFKMYGVEHFEFTTLQEVTWDITREELYTLEQTWIDAVPRQYNICKSATEHKKKPKKRSYSSKYVVKGHEEIPIMRPRRKIRNSGLKTRFKPKR